MVSSLENRVGVATDFLGVSACLPSSRALCYVSLLGLHFVDGDTEAQGRDSRAVSAPGWELLRLSWSPSN